MRSFCPSPALIATVVLSLCSSSSASNEVSLPASTWLSAVRARAQASGFEIVPARGDLPEELRGSLFGAATPSQGFSVAFLQGGIRIVPWDGAVDNDIDDASLSTPSWIWGLELERYGRADALLAAQATTPIASGAHVEYRRGALTEWYENSTEGLEQGFTLAERPDGNGPLRVEMTLAGELEARLDSGERAVEFGSDASARATLRFDKLVCFDVEGTLLDARFELCGDTLAIVVDDSDAAYPITIDPLATNPNWTATGVNSGVKLGFSVATAGDVNGDGYSDVIYGVPLQGSGLFVYGRVYVHHGSPSGLSTVADWSQLGSDSGANFGHCVATAGDVNGDGYSDVIIGSYKYSNGESSEGAAFVYHGGPAGLSSTPNWSAEGNQLGADFGWSVASLGDVNGDGYSDVIVGAPRFDLTSPIAITNAGRAYVYLGSPAGLAANPVATRSGTQAEQRFGASVAGAGDVNGDGLSDAIVGSPLYDHTTGVDAGRFDVFNGSASGGLNLFVTTTRYGSFAGDQLGFSVATAGDVNGGGYADVVVGAPYYSFSGFGGVAEVYHGGASGIAAAANFGVGWNVAGAEWGFSVAPAGDVNGDGYADVVMGAPLADSGAGARGVAYVFFGSASGLSVTDHDSRVGAAASDRFGHCVATAGDVNGDGRSDVLVGAPEFDATQPNAGRAYVYHSLPNDLATSPDWTIAGTQSQQRLGSGVSSAGDLNGDGYGDVVVVDQGSSSNVRFYLGSASGPSTTADYVRTVGFFGLGDEGPCGAAGDINGDGYDDVVFGWRLLATGAGLRNRIEIHFGSPTGPVVTQLVEEELTLTGFGFSVSAAGDVNGDGYADVVVGAPYFNGGHVNEGRVYVYHGSPSGLVATPAFTFEPDAANRNLGFSVSGGGDFNGDGYSDILVGAPRDIASGPDAGPGSVYALFGSPSGITTTGMFSYTNIDTHDRMGWAVSYVGDVNGDGYSDAAWTRSNGWLHFALGDPAGLNPSWLLLSGGFDAPRIAHLGDVNGDGLSDFAEIPTATPGSVRVVLGSSLGYPHAEFPPTFGSAAYGAIGGGVDVNGDGYSDLLLGLPTDDTGGSNAGAAHLHYGNGRPGRSMVPQQRLVDDSAPLALRGWSDDPQQVRLNLQPRTPYGRVRVKLESEIESAGATFDGAGTVSSSTWIQSSVGAPPISELRATSGERQHWRARLRYDLANSPFQHFSRWFTMQGAGSNESKFNRPGFLPFTYCTSGTSSSGCVPTLTASGSPSISASSGFTLTATQIESQKIGRFYYGVNGRHLSTWGSSDSFLCVKAPTQRMGALNSGGGSVPCDGTYVQDWLAYLASNPGALGTPFAPGQVVNVQAWYRDPSSPKTTNLTGGLEFAVIP